MRLRHKLLLVHAFVVAVSTLAFGRLYLNAEEVAAEYRQVYQGILPQVRALEDLRAATAALSRTTHKLARLATLGADLHPGPRREIEGDEARELREAFAGQANALATYRVPGRALRPRGPGVLPGFGGQGARDGRREPGVPGAIGQRLGLGRDPRRARTARDA